MKEGPNFTLIGSLIGDPARANMLSALMAGQALTAGELAREAGVTIQTASTHLKKLAEGGLVKTRPQGRHRYFSLAGADVANALENLMVLAEARGHRRVRPGPADPALRKARSCYDHLAGEMGVLLFVGMVDNGWLCLQGDDIRLSTAGGEAMHALGINMDKLESARRPLCRPCLDWSLRRNHLAGSLGAAILTQICELGWARRVPGTRRVEFSQSGERRFRLLAQGSIDG
ncbi:MAG: winged helix-turn-helix domain-containing protein [Pseudomonadota bacterium]